MDTEGFLDHLDFKRGDTFFVKVKTSFADILNIKQHLEDMMSSGVDKKLKGVIAREKSILNAKWDKIMDESVPVTIGFDANLFMLSTFLNQHTRASYKMYVDYYTRVDKEITAFIGDKDYRNRKHITFTFKDEKEEIAVLTKQFNTLLNFETKSMQKGSIKSLIISRDGFMDTTKNVYNVIGKINEREYAEFVNRNAKLDHKLKVLFELLDGEEVTFSKETLKSLSESISVLADFSTMMGKFILATYETSFILFNIDKVIKHYE